MTEPPQPSPSVKSTEAEGPQLLRRLIGPLLRAGWADDVLELWDEDPDNVPTATFTSVDLERSGCHISLSWSTSSQELTVGDPTEGWEWTEDLPPLFPLDDELCIPLAGYPNHGAKVEAARRAFAAAGLLDTTRVHLPEQARAIQHDIKLLLWHQGISQITELYRGQPDATQAYTTLGEEFSWRIADGLRTYPLIVPAVVPTAAVRGIAEWCWRRESAVEDWHHKVTDLTMARTNIAATRAVLPHVHPEGVDWAAVRIALTHPGRRLGDGSTLAGHFDEGWPAILTSIHAQIDLWQTADDLLGPQTVLRLLSVHGSRTESIGEWWGSGWYETLTRQVISDAARHGTLPALVADTFTDPEQFADTAAQHPDVLDDHLLSWLNQRIFEEQSNRRHTSGVHVTAFTLPDWAAEQLDELLATEPDPPTDGPLRA